MYILKNAMKNLGRNKGRNLLLGIIIFALILSTTVALVIHATSRGIIKDYKTRFGSKVSFRVDFDKLMADLKQDAGGVMTFPTAPEISSEQYMAFSESEHLKSYQMDMLAQIGIPELEPVGGRKGGTMYYGEDDGEQTALSHDAKLLAYSDISSLPGFSEGLRKVMDGSMSMKSNECLISMDFAKLNGLAVGDSFSVMELMGRKEVTLTVSGIYADATQATPDAAEGVFLLDGAAANRRNEILVSMETMKQSFEAKNLSVHAEYELKSPKLLSDFEKELRDKGLPDAYIVETDEAGYYKIVAPVEGLSKISMTFMWIVLLVGGAILLFTTAMVIRERKYEIGVLRAMGMKKAKVAVMLVTEMVLIAAICLGIGLGAGSALSQPVADVFMAEQTEKGFLGAQASGSVAIGAIGGSDAEPLNEIHVSLTADAAVQIALVALLLALLSSAAGVAFIMRYEPMKILSERN